MGPDRRLVIGADPQMVETLYGKHVEMIEPEIDHHLFELARAVERAQHPGLGRLAQDDAGGLAARLDFLRRRLDPIGWAQWPVALEQLYRVEKQRLQSGEPRGELPPLRDCLRVELF